MKELTDLDRIEFIKEIINLSWLNTLRFAEQFDNNIQTFYPVKLYKKKRIKDLLSPKKASLFIEKSSHFSNDHGTIYQFNYHTISARIIELLDLYVTDTDQEYLYKKDEMRTENFGQYYNDKEKKWKELTWEKIKKMIEDLNF